jgi:hypothetical protein
MKPPQRILICGTSIFVAAIESGLNAMTMGEVLGFDPHLPNAPARITALEPNVVIMEKAADNNELAQAVLHQGFPVIILDEAERRITVLSGPSFSDAEVVEAGMEELTQVIKKIMGRDGDN